MITPRLREGQILSGPLFDEPMRMLIIGRRAKWE
jgi:hypothetical protein